MGVIERLNIIFREVFFDDTIEIQPEMTSLDIEGWDSFAHLNIILYVEAEFGVTITDQEAPNLKNIGDLINAIHIKLKGISQ
jgi:acyl carrier protein